ncbi:hypothetical protein EXN66_Car011188 [Channa argus]|uniref:Uncharacterized protein n=1 Tax=Channa argus TaxID=215402 RepID=A0A6G1PZ25_CHAAH|nr:hypothetical protein EXN66_Car011188 [Channa argus]
MLMMMKGGFKQTVGNEVRPPAGGAPWFLTDRRDGDGLEKGKHAGGMSVLEDGALSFPVESLISSIRSRLTEHLTVTALCAPVRGSRCGHGARHTDRRGHNAQGNSCARQNA